MKKTFTCIVCPAGCQITANIADGKVVSMTGNTCAKGLAYVTKEIENPSRLVTSTVKVIGGEVAVVPVRTLNEIPKDKIFELVDMLKGVQVSAPITIGDVIIKDVFGTDVVATNTVEKA